MAFKMTPGMKGNPASKRIEGLGACGGPGQQPCPPRFQQEKTTELVADRSSTSRSKYIKSKKKAAVVAPAPAPAPAPKLQINLPKKYAFADKLQEKMFYRMFEQAIEDGKYKTQEDLDMAVMKQLKGGAPSPFDPTKPVLEVPKEADVPVFEAPIKEGPIKEGPIMVPVKGDVKSEASVKAKSVVAK